MRSVVLSFLAMLVLGSTLLVSRARADEWNERTRFTFSQPFEVPGKILPAGTYWFRLLDSPSDRQIVEIYNADQTKLCATVLAASAWRDDPATSTEVTFAERRHNQPEAIRIWYYPGLQTGHEFLYSSREEKRLDRDPEREVLLPRLDSRNPVLAIHGR